MPHFYRVAQAFPPALLLLVLHCVVYAAPADWIVSARYVITMDARHQLIENGAIAITGDHIVAVGPKAAIEKSYQSTQRLDRPNALIAPGLINTHTHAAMSLFRGIAA